MCEFKIIRKNDGSQIGEDITILNYSESHELLLRDILGSTIKLDSALIIDVNTLNKKTTVLEHPLIKNFLGLINSINNNTVTQSDIDNFQQKINELKEAL
ncbi:MAG TPA: hypothetical protein VGB37_02045 [Candidatus Lokiarchaeia archaeon]